MQTIRWMPRPAHWQGKAGFDPNQPRDDWGRWTNGGGRVEVRPPRPPLDVPTVPKERPSTAQARNRIIKEVAKFAARAVARQVVGGPIGTVLNVVDAGYWLYEHYPLIQAYLDPPKSFDELQQAASTRREGYDNHHVVEKSPAERAGYPRTLIEAPENIVQIPRLKHWEITGWYMKENLDYDGMSPREYLKDKSWDERVGIGTDILIMHGVLKR